MSGRDMRPDLRVLDLAVAVLASATHDTLRRARRGRRHAAVAVNGLLLADLLAAVEEVAPGAVAEARRRNALDGVGYTRGRRIRVDEAVLRPPPCPDDGSVLEWVDAAWQCPAGHVLDADDVEDSTVWVLRGPCGCPREMSGAPSTEGRAWELLAGHGRQLSLEAAGWRVAREPAYRALPDVRRRRGRCGHGESRVACCRMP